MSDPKIGEVFNKLTLQKIENKWIEKEKRNRKIGTFLCVCGKIYDTKLTNVVSGRIISCGCSKKNNGKHLPKYNKDKAKNYIPEYNIGDKYNKLILNSIPYRGKGNKFYAIFTCECGNQKEINYLSVKNSIVRSCGCLCKEETKKMLIKRNTKYTKEMVESPIYELWNKLIHKSDLYICSEWKDYNIFYKWAKEYFIENYCLNMKDRTLGYFPENCYFCEFKELMQTVDNNREKAKKTCIDKYGFEFPMQSIEISTKSLNTRTERYNLVELADKAKKTMFEKYGVDSYTKTDEFKERVKNTNINKYGFESTTQVPDFKEKIKNTNLERYGFDRATKNQSVKDKISDTCMKRFGCKSPSQNPDIRKKQINTNIAKYGVPFYNKTTGKQQKAVQDFIENITNQKFLPDWKVLDGKEIDIYNDELKFGIEYCGLKWHLDKPRTYHYNKFKQCKNKGIRLITLFSDEWLTRQSQVKSFLSASLGYFNERLYARKCIVKIIDKKIGYNFIETNHIQGGITKSKIYFGLFNGNRIVGVMSFGPHHRHGHNELVLDRLSFLPYVQIIGGAAKLLNAGIDWARKNNYSTIISWSDNRISNGNVYEKMGFTLDANLAPDYSYVVKQDPKKRIGKQSMTKKKLGCKEGQTEFERAEELGYSKIWDCGKIRWKIEI